MARREFISIEDGELHAERSLVLARVEELLLIPHGIKRMSDDTHPKGVTEDDHERVHVPRNLVNLTFKSDQVKMRYGFEQLTESVSGASLDVRRTMGLPPTHNVIARLEFGCAALLPMPQPRNVFLSRSGSWHSLGVRLRQPCWMGGRDTIGEVVEVKSGDNEKDRGVGLGPPPRMIPTCLVSSSSSNASLS